MSASHGRRDPEHAAPRRRPRGATRASRIRDPRVLGGIVVAMAVIVAVMAFLLLARGDDSVVVPDIIGMPTDEAVETLGDIGLVADTVLVVRDDASPGTVVGQDPDAGASVEPGAAVRLEVARDDADPSAGQVVVPNLIGLTQADAVATLTDLGLAVDTEPVDPGGAAPGTVVDQDPPQGTALGPGSHVRLQVAQDTTPEVNVIAWILSLGPGAPTGPPEYQAYQLLLDRDCVGLEAALADPDSDISTLAPEVRSLYGAAADACLAAFAGATDRWTAAQAALGGLQRPVSCIDAAAYDLLAQLVAEHDRNPAGQFEAAGSGGIAPPCPMITALEPDRGPLGTVVRVAGANLDRVERVLIEYDNGDLDDLQQPVLENGSLSVTIDARDDARFGCIYLEAATGWNADGRLFTILPADGTPQASDAALVAPPDPCPPESQE